MEFFPCRFSLETDIFIFNSVALTYLTTTSLDDADSSRSIPALDFICNFIYS